MEEVGTPSWVQRSDESTLPHLYAVLEAQDREISLLRSTTSAPQVATPQKSRAFGQSDSRLLHDKIAELQESLVYLDTKRETANFAVARMVAMRTQWQEVQLERIARIRSSAQELVDLQSSFLTSTEVQLDPNRASHATGSIVPPPKNEMTQTLPVETIDRATQHLVPSIVDSTTQTPPVRVVEKGIQIEVTQVPESTQTFALGASKGVQVSVEVESREGQTTIVHTSDKTTEADIAIVPPANDGARRERRERNRRLLSSVELLRESTAWLVSNSQPLRRPPTTADASTLVDIVATPPQEARNVEPFADRMRMYLSTIGELQELQEAVVSGYLDRHDRVEKYIGDLRRANESLHELVLEAPDALQGNERLKEAERANSELHDAHTRQLETLASDMESEKLSIRSALERRMHSLDEALESARDTFHAMERAEASEATSATSAPSVSSAYTATLEKRVSEISSATNSLVEATAVQLDAALAEKQNLEQILTHYKRIVDEYERLSGFT